MNKNTFIKAISFLLTINSFAYIEDYPHGITEIQTQVNISDVSPNSTFEKKLLKFLQASSKLLKLQQRFGEFPEIFYFLTDVVTTEDAAAVSSNYLYRQNPMGEQMKSQLREIRAVVRDYHFPEIPTPNPNELNIQELQNYTNREQLRIIISSFIHQTSTWKEVILESNYLLHDHKFRMYDYNIILRNAKNASRACVVAVREYPNQDLLKNCLSLYNYVKDVKNQTRKFEQKRKDWEPKLKLNKQAFKSRINKLNTLLLWEEKKLELQKEKYLKELQMFIDNIANLNTALIEVENAKSLKKDYVAQINRYFKNISRLEGYIKSNENEISSLKIRASQLCTPEYNNSNYYGCKNKLKYSECEHEVSKNKFDKKCANKKKSVKKNIKSLQKGISRMKQQIQNDRNNISNYQSKIHQLNLTIGQEQDLVDRFHEEIKLKEEFEQLIQSFMTNNLLEENQRNQETLQTLML